MAKNIAKDRRPMDNPYMVIKRPDGVEWRVVRFSQQEGNMLYATSICGVKTPRTRGKYVPVSVPIIDLRNAVLKERAKVEDVDPIFGGDQSLIMSYLGIGISPRKQQT